MKRILFILALSFFSLNSFSQVTKGSVGININKANKNEVLKVFLDVKGKIFVDGKKMSLKKLDKKLIELKAKNGIVYYSRINTKNEKVIEISKKITDAIRNHKRPIQFFTDNTFSKEIVW